MVDSLSWRGFGVIGGKEAKSALYDVDKGLSAGTRRIFMGKRTPSSYRTNTLDKKIRRKQIFSAIYLLGYKKSCTFATKCIQKKEISKIYGTQSSKL